jgi:hypothetical protein
MHFFPNGFPAQARARVEAEKTHLQHAVRRHAQTKQSLEGTTKYLEQQYLLRSRPRVGNAKMLSDFYLPVELQIQCPADEDFTSGPRNSSAKSLIRSRKWPHPPSLSTVPVSNLIGYPPKTVLFGGWRVTQSVATGQGLIGAVPSGFLADARSAITHQVHEGGRRRHERAGGHRRSQLRWFHHHRGRQRSLLLAYWLRGISLQADPVLQGYLQTMTERTASAWRSSPTIWSSSSRVK